MQHNRPGKVYFDVGSEFGTLETLGRRKITASTPVDTAEIQAGKLYQASAVLVAPDSFPLDTSAANDGLPKREFEVGVKFVCGCGDANCSCGTEEPISPIKLEIYATPVIFIHGIYGTFSGTFTTPTLPLSGKNGAFRTLMNNNIDIGYWDYLNTEGPTSLIINKINSGQHSDLFKVITAMFRRMLVMYNIACTRVDIICHSMGGLMARTFLAHEDEMSSRSYYNSMVRRLITIATPQEGSPMTMYLMGNAEDMPYLQDPNTDKNEAHIARAIEILRDGNKLSRLQANMGKTNSYTPGAWIDLALESNLVKHLRDEVGKPSVPIHVIYGTFDEEGRGIPRSVHWIVQGAYGLNQIPQEYRELIKNAPDLLRDYDTFSALFNVLFNGDPHDIAVGRTSAVSIFDNSYITSEVGLQKNHLYICFEDTIGKRVLDLLKGNLSNFDTSGVGKSSSYTPPTNRDSLLLSSQSIPADNGAVSDFFLNKYTLSVTTPAGSEYTAPAAFTVEGSSDITLTLTTENPAEHNIYLSIGNEAGGSFLMMQSVDSELKTFTATMTLPQNYSGTMNIHALSSPNAEDTGHVYISDTLEINIIPELNAGSSIQSLSFMGNSSIILDVDSQVSLGLFAVTDDGEYLDVSVPAVANTLGISCYFADGGIAEITDTGKIHGLSSGSTALTAEYNGTSAVISVDIGIKQSISEMPQSTDKTLFITTDSLSEGQAGVFYNQILASTISFTDYVAWSASGLPDGIACDIGGILTGKPLTSGTYSVEITASSDTETASRTLPLVITASENPYAPIISTQSLPAGYINQEYSADITAAASGDKSSMTWSIYSGSLPEGLSFASMNGESITLSGIPTESGSFQFMIEASLNWYSDIQSFTLVISEPSAPEIDTSLLPDGTVGTAYSAQLQASGTSPITWEIAGGNLPDGLTLSEDTGEISGTPSAAGEFRFSVSASNLAGTASRDISITINNAPAPEQSPDVTPPEPHASDDVTPPKPHTSGDITPHEPDTSGDITPPDEHEDIEIGPARGVESLNSYELAQVSNDRNMIAAVLPEVTVNVAGVYDFTDIDLAENVPVGAVLEWYPFEKTSGGEVIVSATVIDSGVQFFDSDGREITTVPASHNINVSAYLEAVKTYAPVISAVISEHSGSPESHDVNARSQDIYKVGSGGGGCAVGISGVFILAALGLFLKGRQ